MTCREKIVAQSYIDLIEERDAVGDWSDMEELCQIRLGNADELIYISKDAAKEIFPNQEMYSNFPRCYGLVGEVQGSIANWEAYAYEALAENGILEMQSSLKLTGKGTILAFIGPGIDLTSPLFRKPDGTTRILRMWDQSLQTGTPPQYFPYGSELREEDINRLLRQQGFITEPGTGKEQEVGEEWNKGQELGEERNKGSGTGKEQELGEERNKEQELGEERNKEQELGEEWNKGQETKKRETSLEEVYGTAVLGTACGQLSAAWESLEQRTQITQSPAPEADLIVVKLKTAKEYLKAFYCIQADLVYQENDIMTAFAYVSQFVEVRKKPVIAFCPLGTTQGNHGGDGALDRYISQLLGKRNFVTIWPAGDEGALRRHYEGSFAAGGAPQEIELEVDAGEQDFMMEFWAEKPATYLLTLQTPAGESTQKIFGNGVNWREFDWIFSGGKTTVTYLMTESRSGWQAAFFRFQKAMEGIWLLKIEATDVWLNSKYHLWLPMSNFLKAPIFFPGATPYTTLTHPIAEGGMLGITSYAGSLGGLSAFASRGYGVAGELYPDLAATGEAIPTVYGAVSSTAISAAYVAGAACQLFEWSVVDGQEPALDGNECKNYLLRGAERRNGLQYPNPSWGYGTLQLTNTFVKIAGIANM